LKTSRPTVLLWRERFAEAGPVALQEDVTGRGRKARIPAKKIREIVEATLHTEPEAATHWSVRTMAAAQGVSAATVQRIWDAHGLEPHRVRTFKISRDRRFVEKLADVVGLYLNPPGQSPGIVRGREDANSGIEPNTAGSSDEKGPVRHHDPRLTSATGSPLYSPR
jgi:hypothetical protein